jgi:hypothetical protein
LQAANTKKQHKERRSMLKFPGITCEYLSAIEVEAKNGIYADIDDEI